MLNTSPGGNPTVLLVEDDDDIREVTRLMLRQRGFDVLVAGDAASAMMTCRVHEGDIDILLTDLGLPGVSGGELARSTTALRPAMEVVYISGVPRDVAVAQGLIRAGAQFVAKPFTAEVLAGTLRAVVARSVSGRASRR